MKKLNVLTRMLLLVALLVGITSSVWAAAGDPQWSYSVVNGDASKLNTTAKTFTVDESHVWNYDGTVAAGSPGVAIGSANSTYALKFGTGSKAYFNPVTLSTDAFSDKAVTKVSLYLKHNGSKVGTLTVKQGDVTIGTAETENTSDWITVTSSTTATGAGGTLEIKYEVAQALYINKIEVWYEDMARDYWVVTYDYNDGITPNKRVNVNKGDDAAAYTLEAAPSREHYNFDGWKIGESTYTAGASHALSGDITATAQWSFDGIYTTYNRSGKNDMATGAEYIMGAVYSETWKFATTMAGQTYLNADVVGEDGSLDEDAAQIATEIPEVITLNETADGWEMITENGKIGLKGDKKLGYDQGDTTWDLGGTDEVPTLSATFEKDGTPTTYIMKFNWNSGSSRFNAYTSGQQDVYFYRLDNGKNVYTLTLNFNDGVTEDGTHKVLETADYTLTTPTRSGYAFMGWNTAENGSGTNYNAGAYKMPAANTTLYAQWATTTTITLNAACTDGEMVYGTFSCPAAFEVSDEIIVSEIGIDNEGKLDVQAYTTGDIVPANTGVMVSALEGGDYVVNLSNEAGTSVLGSDNRLRGSGSGISAAAMETADAGCVYYRLTMHGKTNENPGTIGFYYGADGGAAFALGANKAYLAVPETSAKEGFSFISEEDETDGINAVSTKVENGVRYNLAGQKVDAAYKGIVIVNGKKMLNK